MNSPVRNLCAGLAASVALMVSASLGMASDYNESVPEVVIAPPAVGGWYLRGDVGYSAPKFRGASYTLPDGDGCNGCGEDDLQIHGGKLKGAFLFGGGVGYQVTDYFRTDLTLDYMTRAKFTSDHDESQMSALSLLANAYVDLGNFAGVTPYVGAGIGGTRVKWNDLVDTTNDGVLSGDANWRFTYALMAGASVDLTQSLKLDAGYRYRHINGGKMFNGDFGVGDGYDKGMNVHDIRVGLRYMFGG